MKNYLKIVKRRFLYFLSALLLVILIYLLVFISQEKIYQIEFSIFFRTQLVDTFLTYPKLTESVDFKLPSAEEGNIPKIDFKSKRNPEGMLAYLKSAQLNLLYTKLYKLISHDETIADKISKVKDIDKFLSALKISNNELAELSKQVSSHYKLSLDLEELPSIKCVTSGKTEKSARALARAIKIVIKLDILQETSEQITENLKKISKSKRWVKNKMIELRAKITNSFAELDKKVRTLENELRKIEKKYSAYQKLIISANKRIAELANAFLQLQMAGKPKLETEKETEKYAREANKIEKEMEKSFQKVEKEMEKCIQEKELKLTMLKKWKAEKPGYFLLRDNLEKLKVISNNLQYLEKLCIDLSNSSASFINQITPFKLILPENINPFNRYFLLAILLGVSTGIFSVYLREHYEKNITYEYEVKQITNWNLIGVIPLVKDSQKIDTDRLLKTFHAIARRLSFSMNFHQAKMVSITSAGIGEGKTFIATGLAIALSRQGHKTLLIRTNGNKPLVNPSATTKFDIDKIFNLKPLSTQENNSAEIVKTYLLEDINQNFKERIYPTNIEKLFLFNVPNSPRLINLINSQDFLNFATTIKRIFDYIVIDSPAVLFNGGALLLSKYSDTTLVVSASGILTKKHLRWCKSLIDMTTPNIIGTIINFYMY